MNINGLPQNPVFQSVNSPIYGNTTPSQATTLTGVITPYLVLDPNDNFGAGTFIAYSSGSQQFKFTNYNTGTATITVVTADPLNQARAVFQNAGGAGGTVSLSAWGNNAVGTDFGLPRAGRVVFMASAGTSGLYIGTTVVAPISFATNNIEQIRIEPSGGLSLGRTSLNANAWDGSGIVLYNLPGRTYTDRTSTGVKGMTSLVSFFPATVTATSGAAFTDLATFAVVGAPTVGVNTTGVNRWTAFLSGDTRVDGNIVLGRTSATTGTKIGYTTNYIQFNSGNGNLLYQGLNPAYPVGNVTGNFTLTGGQFRYVWTGSATALGTGILPSPSLYSGMDFMVKNISSSTSLSLSGSVDYGVNYTMTPLQGIRLWSDNNSWLLI